MPVQDELIVSVSGIRGIVGESLTPAVAGRFAQALGSEAAGGTILISRDGRPSGWMFGHAVAAGLMSVGCRVIDLGIQPTPTVGVAVTHFQAAGAIQLSASHNPAPYNGLKLFGADGAVLSPQVGQRVVQRFREGGFHLKDALQTGTYISPVESGFDGQPHLDRILQAVPVKPPFRGKPLKVLVDVNHGAGGAMSRKLLESFNAEMVMLDAEPSGQFAHTPEPTAENLQSIAPRVAEVQADVGFALDPDADRLAIIDETGRYIGEELTLALALDYRLRQTPGPVVVNMSTSRVNEQIAVGKGCPFHRSSVGEANVVAMMRQCSAVIGGEGNGGVIDPRIGWVRDPFIGMAFILDHLLATGMKISEWVASLPHWIIVKEKYTLDRSWLPGLYDRLLATYPDWQVNRQDGLRLDGPKSWLHLRPSNTEPIVRVIAEASTEAEAHRLCQQVGEMLRGWPAANH